MPNYEHIEKLNDYTASLFTQFERQSGAEPALRRIFNFSARQVTEIYSQYSGHGVANSMVVRNFSDLDSLAEVEMMHKWLKEKGGHPPEIDDLLTNTKPVAKGPALRA